MGLGVAPTESPTTTSHYLSIQRLALSAAFWSNFQCPIMALTTSCCVRVHLGWSKMVPIEMSTTPHFYLTSLHTMDLSCIIWPQCITRQTDRAIRIGRLCYSSCGPNYYYYYFQLTLVLACSYPAPDFLQFTVEYNVHYNLFCLSFSNIVGKSTTFIVVC